MIKIEKVNMRGFSKLNIKKWVIFKYAVWKGQKAAKLF